MSHVLVETPPYADGNKVAPYIIKANVANAEDTVLVGTQVS